MSTEFFAFPNISNDTPNVRSDKYFVVRSEQEPLHDYVRRMISDKSLSYREVSERSGGNVSPATISDIINQRVRHIRTETLKALAKGLQVSEEEIFAVARGTTLEPNDIMEEVGVLFFGWEDASEEDRAATLDAIRMIAGGFQQRRQKSPPRPATASEAQKEALAIRRQPSTAKEALAEAKRQQRLAGKGKGKK